MAFLATPQNGDNMSKAGVPEVIEKSNVAPLAQVKIFFSLVFMRKQHNMTQSELAEKLGVEQSYLSLIENGKRKPNPELLHKIAEVFDKTVEELDIEPWTVEMAKQMLAEDVASMYFGKGELSRSKDDRQFLLQVVRTLTPQVLVEEKVTTSTDEDGKKILERVEQKLVAQGINIKS